MARQSKKVQELKNNLPPNATNANSLTPKKFLLCCLVAIRVDGYRKKNLYVALLLLELIDDLWNFR
jgi:hypothetical protein